MFVAGPETLARVTQRASAVTDDWPSLEYGAVALVDTTVPAELFDPATIEVYCPRCVRDPSVAPLVPHLGAYVGLLAQYYQTPGFRTVDPSGRRRNYSWSVELAPSSGDGDGFSTTVSASDVPRLLQFSGYLRDFLDETKP
jgi:hypothetical protein